jgi:hypothetical protein
MLSCHRRVRPIIGVNHRHNLVWCIKYTAKKRWRSGQEYMRRHPKRQSRRCPLPLDWKRWLTTAPRDKPRHLTPVVVSLKLVRTDKESSRALQPVSLPFLLHEPTTLQSSTRWEPEKLYSGRIWQNSLNSCHMLNAVPEAVHRNPPSFF